MKKVNLLLLVAFISSLTTFSQWTRTEAIVKLTNSSDKVGIGISDPLEKLHINGAIRGNETDGALMIKTASGYIAIGPQNKDWCHFKTDRDQYYFNKPVFIKSGYIASYLNDDLKLCTSNDGRGDLNTRLTIKTSNGNVGIGISDPAEKLHINGAIRGNEENGALKVKTSRGYLLLGPRNSGWCHLETDMDRFYFNKEIHIHGGKLVSYGIYSLDLCTGVDGTKNTNTRLTIKNSNGYVGIGTTNPQSLLAVKGIITAQEVVITMDGWADYVFADNYKLMPLNELESHIKVNRHLPGIPSEANILENGAAMGTISAKMLSKIEELTLYVIEQNKQIESLKKEVEVLKSPKN